VIARVALGVAALALVACTGSQARARAEGPKADDVAFLARQMRQLHPNLFHDLDPKVFDAAVASLEQRADALGADELLVELMRLAALPGLRDGHTGLFPFLSHSRALAAYPLWPYRFDDGWYVVDARDTSLVGSRITAVGGVPIDDAVARIRPLVPRDNDVGQLAVLPLWLITAEVLHGLGLSASAERARFVLERDEVRREVELEAAPYHSVPHAHGLPQRTSPLFLRHRDRAWWVTTLDGGRAVYAEYNVVSRAAAFELETRIGRLAAQRRVQRIVVDVRNNGGGDNTTYHGLVATIRRVAARKPVFVLIGRVTFSAAGNFVAEVDRTTKASLVGESTGGAPNQWGDGTRVTLPATGWDVQIANQYVQVTTRSDTRTAVEPDVRVLLRAADFFAGRDPVLAAALKAAPGPERVVAGDPSFFAYDTNRPLALELGSTQSGGGVVRQELTFDAGRGPVHGYWTHPPGDGPWPVVLFSPGFRGDDTDQLPEANRLVSKGIASLTVTPPASLITCNGKADVQAYRDYVVGRRRALDLLSQLRGADTTRVAAVGFSFGAAVTATLAGVDHRLRAAVIQSGRAHLSTATSVACTQLGKAKLAAWKKTVSVVDPVRWVGTSRPAALLFQNGTRDTISPRADVNAFVRAAGKPKELRWYKAAHALNAAAFAYRDNWLAKRLR
jgi:dienelactone hydrolase